MKQRRSRISRPTGGSLGCLLVLVACAALAEPETIQAQTPDMAASVAPLFGMIERSFVALADAMPAETYGFRPTEGEFQSVRTFGEQVKHVACANFAFFNEVESKEPPAHCDTGGPSPATTKAELMTYLRQSFEYGRSVLESMTAENALDATTGPYGGESTRLALTSLAIWHASDHYGQLVVYLRLNGIIPPASRSAG